MAEETTIIVHPCCGCTCDVCKDGHNATRKHHTEACMDRALKEADANNPTT